MSWNAYVENQIAGVVPCRFAVIAGLADGAVWAKTENSELIGPVTPEKIKEVADTMRANPASFQEKGIRVGGEKFLCLSTDSNLVRGRKGSSALSIVTTNTCLLIAATIDGFAPGSLNTTIEKLADYLKSQGY